MRQTPTAIVLIVTVFCCACAPRTTTTDGGRYGQVKIAEPEGEARAVVIFFSDRNGLSPADDTAAQTIAKGGALVTEVDTTTYLNRLDKVNEKCHQPAFDAEWFSRHIQRERGFPNYLTPILVGVGEGATLVAMTLSWAPAATIAGAISIDPSATITSKQPICSGAYVQHGPDGFRYGAESKMSGVWSIVLTTGASKESRDYVTALRREGAPALLCEVGKNQSIGAVLLALMEQPWAKPKDTLSDISALPLTVLGVEHPSKVMAIVISGDGGWRDLDKTIAEDLQRKGVPVVGWDSLRYFWSKKTPVQVANDLATVMRTFMARWNANEVALIGYSFGADVMPFAYNRLPDALRSQVKLIALLGFSRTADFEITVSGWLGEPPGPKALPIFAETEKIPAPLIQCFYGQAEGDSACPDLAHRGIETIRTGGGHHFDSNYDALAERILAGLNRRVTSSSQIYFGTIAQAIDLSGSSPRRPRFWR